MLYLTIKYIHILSAIIAVGSNLTYNVWIAYASRQSPQNLTFALHGIRHLDKRLANRSYAFMLVTGLTMAYLSRRALTTSWLLIGITLYVSTALLGIFVYAPNFRRQIRLAETVGIESPIYQAVAKRSKYLGWITTGIVLVIIFLMVIKPNFW